MPTTPSRTVLVVEDDPDHRWLMARTLADDGHTVIEAMAGDEALEKALQRPPDLILMDLGLPKLDDWETTRRMKASATLRHIPVLAVTAYAMRGDEEAARAAGCTFYLRKPVRLATIRDIVRGIAAR